MLSCKREDYSLYSILKITLPLILSSLTATLMMSVDRFVMSLFSIQSMNALSLVSSYMAIPSLFLSAIASISAVFVGQYNGECGLKQIGRPVWQMVYFSLMSAVFGILFAIFPDVVCPLPKMYYEEGIKYQTVFTAAIWLAPMFSAISGFFIGRGKTAIVTVNVVLSNFVNLVLDIVLVFGINGLIPPLGIVGAAVATAISQLFGLLIMFGMFLSPKNREMYSTHNYSFDKNMFFRCIKIGLPAAADRVFSLSAWATIFLLLGRVSDDLATLESITVAVYLVFCCYTDGLNKGAAAITANLIGENKKQAIDYVFKSYMKINLFFCLVISIPLVFCQDILFFFLEKMNGDITHLRGEFQFIFYMLFIIILFDGILWVIAGILAGGGDTLWPAIVNTILVWIIIVLPVGIMYFNNSLNSVREMNELSALASIVTAILFYFRYKRGNTMNKIV